MSSSSVDGVCAMLNHACTLLEQDFREVLYSRVRTGFPSGFDLHQAYNMVQSSIQQGKLQASDTEKSKTQFIVSGYSVYKAIYFNPLSAKKKIYLKMLSTEVICCK